jgi:hypothetical protein
METTTQPTAVEGESVNILQRYTNMEDFVINEKLQLQHLYPRAFVRITFILIILGIFFALSWLTWTPLLFPWFIYPEYFIVLIIGVLFVLGNPNYSDKVKKTFSTEILDLFHSLTILGFFYHCFNCNKFIHTWPNWILISLEYLPNFTLDNYFHFTHFIFKFQILF